MATAESSQSIIKGVKGLSPFACFPNFDVVFSFNFDYMHSVCLGTAKHLIKTWLMNKKNYFVNGSLALKTIKDNCKMLYLPKKIKRKLSDLSDVENWKASQFRDFLLFYGPVLLKDVLKPQYYSNFCNFSFAIYSFLSEELSEEDFLLASEKLITFVLDFQILYGIENMRYNVHLISHIPLFVINSGLLWVNSLFSFEGMNRYVNKFINGTNNIIQEATVKLCLYNNRRLGEKPQRNGNFYFNGGATTMVAPKVITLPNNLNIPNLRLNFDYKEISNFIFANEFFEKKPTRNKICDDSFVELYSGVVGQIYKILVEDNNLIIVLMINFEITSSSGQINYLEDLPRYFEVCQLSDIKRKVLFFNSCFTSFPNRYEFD